MCLFGERLEPLFSQADTNLGESNSLTTLRDALLPKLLSGEIRVQDAERRIEEAI
jgi:type I restriction enzyme S subunit